MKKILFTLCFVSGLLVANAQKKKGKEKETVISLDTISAVCKDLPIDQRPRVTVARFSVSSPRRPAGDFGDNVKKRLDEPVSEHVISPRHVGLNGIRLYHADPKSRPLRDTRRSIF